MQKVAMREVYKNKKLLPLDLHPKKTRATRRKLTEHQASLKTERQKKREMYFPLRKFPIKALIVGLLYLGHLSSVIETSGRKY